MSTAGAEVADRDYCCAPDAIHRGESMCFSCLDDNVCEFCGFLPDLNPRVCACEDDYDPWLQLRSILGDIKEIEATAKDIVSKITHTGDYDGGYIERKSQDASANKEQITQQLKTIKNILKTIEQKQHGNK